MYGPWNSKSCNYFFRNCIRNCNCFHIWYTKCFRPLVRQSETISSKIHRLFLSVRWSSPTMYITMRPIFQSLSIRHYSECFAPCWMAIIKSQWDELFRLWKNTMTEFFWRVDGSSSATNISPYKVYNLFIIYLKFQLETNNYPIFYNFLLILLSKEIKPQRIQK
jgi:hypothetical protein